MSVYIDSYNAEFQRGKYKMKMCHMIADTLDELHAMADTIGVNRKWFQANSSFPHYDICLTKKTIAIKHGAIEVTSKELITKIRELRNNARLQL